MCSRCCRWRRRCSRSGPAKGIGYRLKERAMPHVIIKLHSGKSETQKTRLAEEIAQALMTSLGDGEESDSVGVDDVGPRDWGEKIYNPAILHKPFTIHK